MAKPTLHFEELRKIAETASGNRYTSTWFEFTESDGILNLRISDSPITATDDSTVIEYTGWARPVLPPVTTATIGSGTTIVDLLAVPVPPNPLVESPAGTVQADAVFWSASAIEKFAVPYYASVYGNQAGEVVQKLVNIFVPPGSPELGGASGEQEQDPFFAVVHLPSSEYVAERLSGPTSYVHTDLFGIHVSGRVERL